jgi:hypothetical protein
MVGVARRGAAGVNAVDLRPRSAPEIIDAGVQLARRHFAVLFVTAAVPLLPYLAFDVRNTWGGDGRQWAWLALAAACASVADAAVAHAAAAAWHGHSPDARTALRATAARLWPVLATGLYRTTFVLLGLGLLIAPGLILLSIYALVPGIAVLEPTLGARAALRRSRALTAGWRWQAFACHAVPYLFAIGANIVVSELGQQLGGGKLFGGVAGTLVDMMLTPFVIAIQVVLYYDLRIRKEEYDIETMLANDAAAA